MKMLTPAEVAERLRVSYDTALHLIKYSGLPYLRIGRQYRMSEVVLDDLITRAYVVTVDYDEAG